MRVYCKCGEKARVTKSERISDVTRHFYVACKECGREHHGTIHLDRETRPARDDLSFALMNVIGGLSVDDQREIVDRYSDVGH